MLRERRGLATGKLDPQASPAALFGAELRSMREDKQLTLAELGRLVHVGPDMLRKIEKAHRRAQTDLVDKLDAVLDANGKLKRLAADIVADTRGQWAPPELNLPAEAAVPVLRGVVDAARNGDHAMNAGAEIGLIVAHAEAAERVIRQVDRSLRPDLSRTIGEAYQLAGWMSFDQGMPARAETLFERARKWAERTSDIQLVAYILGPNLSFVATYTGQSALGVERAYGALGWARRSENHRLTAFTLTIAARAHARLRETRLCLDLLDQASDELQQHASTEDDKSWLAVFDQAALDGHRGSCLLDLGLPDRAVAPLQDQSSAGDSRFVRNRVIWQLDRADAHLRMGKIDEACHDLDVAMAMPSGSVTPRVLRRFRAVDIQLREYAMTDRVGEARERLRGLIAANA
ncbi:hypothetical protein GCM10009609_19640 [Pseudonocardia aurantiaca]